VLAHQDFEDFHRVLPSFLERGVIALVAVKPSAVKELTGNPGHRALNENEPKPIACIPKCPKHLDEEARAEWRRITPELLKLQVLARVDCAALSAYCMAWSGWVDAETNLRKFGAVIKTPKGYPIQNPYLGIANTAIANT
jgi:P27 family predicted phage terminase small subunit